MSAPPRKRPFGKVTFAFSTIIVVLAITILVTGFLLSNRIDSIQADKESLQSQISSLQTAKDQLQTSYNNLQSQYNQLKSQSSSSSSQTSELTNLQNQITNLQSQLANATALIAQLQGQTGILPVYMDLGLVGPINGGDFILSLSLKNTGPLPITQIFVTCDSAQFTIPFTYLNNVVSADTPLPPYQTATGTQDVTPPVGHVNTYPLIIQATASNGTIYTYQTTITSHT